MSEQSSTGLHKPLEGLEPYELENDRHYKTADLLRALGMSKSTFYARLREIALQPRRIKQATYLSEGQATELLQYLDYLSRGGNLQGWQDRKALSERVEQTQPEAPEPTDEQAFVPFDHLRTLSEAAREGWWLSTAQLAELLQVSENTVPRQGSVFEAYGFRFERKQRWGRQLQWSVRSHSD